MSSSIHVFPWIITFQISARHASFTFGPSATSVQRSATTLQIPSPVVSSDGDWIICQFGLYGTSLTNIKRLQNGLARVVARLPTRSPTTPTLKELHWLPIRHRIDYKIATLTYKFLDCGEPTYLHSRISFCVPRRELRSSADTRRLNALRTKTVIADRAFRSSAPAVCNALPLDVRSAPCIATKDILFWLCIWLTFITAVQSASDSAVIG